MLIVRSSGTTGIRASIKVRLPANLSDLGICRLADLRGFLCSKIAFLTTAKRNQLFAGLCERFIYFFGSINFVPGKTCEFFEDTSLNQFLYIPFCNRECSDQFVFKLSNRQHWT